MAWLQQVLKEFTPPIVLRLLRTLRTPAISLSGHYQRWDEAAAQCSGYDAADILKRTLHATLEVQSGRAVFERDSVIFSDIQYSWPALAGILLAAARHPQALGVLDFGGSLGSSFFQNRRFLQQLPSTTWGVVEQAHYIEAGRQYVKTPSLNFYKTIDECRQAQAVDVLLLSSVLQYLPDPFAILAQLLDVAADVIVVDRTCFWRDPNLSTVVRVQSVSGDIGRASYPCWVFNQEQVLAFIQSRGYTLIEAFSALDNFDSSAEWKGFIFLRGSR